MIPVGPPLKILTVPGSMIRERVKRHIEQIDQAIETYNDAIARGIDGIDWQRAKTAVMNSRRASEWILPVIADGPHALSCSQWIDLNNMFSDVRTAAELIEEFRRQQADQAIRTPPAAGTPTA